MAKAGTNSTPFARRDLVDRRHQHIHPFRVGSVLTVAVGRFDNHEIGLLEAGGISKDRGLVPAQVTGEDDVGRLGPIEAQFDHRRAEDVPGVVEGGADPRRHRDRLVVGHRFEAADRLLDIGKGVERMGISARASGGAERIR